MHRAGTPLRTYHIATVVVALVSAANLTACTLGTSTDSAGLAAAVPTAFTLASGGLQSGTVAAPLASPVVLKLTDQFGLASKGVMVTFTMSSSSGSVSPASTITDSTGSASTTWTLGTLVGTDTLVASVSGLGPVTVLAIAHAGAPATLVLVSGAGQSATAGTTLAPIVLKVSDQYGNPVPNVSVNWSSDGNGTFAAASEVSDAFGIVQNVYTLAPAPGRQNIVASVVTTTNAVLTSTLFVTGT